jgi:hypothetical protein
MKPPPPIFPYCHPIAAPLDPELDELGDNPPVPEVVLVGVPAPLEGDAPPAATPELALEL